jgi:hypothetical protein
MTGLLFVLAAIAAVVAFCGGCAYTERHRADLLDPDFPGLLDVADGARCQVATICPSDPHGLLEQCRRAAGHDGPHEHPHDLDEDDASEWYPCYAAVIVNDASGLCCLEAVHAGPHVPAVAIGPGGYAPGQRR